jgi:hypothetical protein
VGSHHPACTPLAAVSAAAGSVVRRYHTSENRVPGLALHSRGKIGCTTIRGAVICFFDCKMTL